MSSEIEMDDLSNAAKPTSEENTQNSSENERDGAISAWTLMAASSLTIFAAILTIFPQFLLFLSTDTPSTLTDLERFLATHFGIWIFTIAITLILTIPDTSSSPIPLALNQSDHGPLLKPFTFACLISSIISYNIRTVGSLATLHCLITGGIGLWGLWVIIFGSSARISKKTGADKHTSAFIFGNKSAASKQKKDWLKQRKGKQGRESNS